jgi:nucleotide-binding universal stress UspA family protein
MSDTGSPKSAEVIVVAVEPGQPDTVLLQACALATDLGCDLICASVDLGRYPVQEHPDGTIVSLPFDPDLPELGEEEFDPKLAAHITAALAQVNVTYRLCALAGDPARALGHLADTVNARFIVLGTHQPGIRRGIHNFFNGSVAVHLAHRQHRPIVVVPLAPVSEDSKLPWE